MKKQGKKILLIILIILLTLSSLSACSSEDIAEPETENTEKETAGTVSLSGDDSGADSDSLRAMAVKYAEKTIGVQLGTVFDTVVNNYIPEATVEYYNSNADMALALKTGKISAYVCDEPMARLLCKTYTDQYIAGAFEKCPYAYVFPKNIEKTNTIRTQMNDFLKKINSDGTIAEIDAVWFGDDESKKEVDTSDLTGENGTLEFAIVSAVGAPFAYLKDNSYVGYDIDIAVRFCREYGYDINITDYNAGGFFASIASGMSDFGASSICITEERMEKMDFSDPNYEGKMVLVTRDQEETDVFEVSDASDFAVLNGKNIGVIRDTIGVEYIEKTIPSCNIVEIEKIEELAKQLESGKIDSYFIDQPIARQMLQSYQNHHVLGVAEKADYAFVFKKNNQHSDYLRAQMNQFLQSIREDGTLEEIDSIWFGEDKELKKIDFSSLNGNNGTIRIAISTGIAEPFAYYQQGELCGYEADIAYRFCKAYGYKLEFVDTEFANIFDLVNSGQCDMGASCITITEDRQKLFNFSDPDYNGGTVIVIKRENEFDVSEISDPEIFSQLNGKKIGYHVGSIMKNVAEEVIDSPEMVAFSSSAEISKALEDGIIDAYIMDQPVARIQLRQYTNQHVHSVATNDVYAYAFQKENLKYPRLKKQMDYFLKDIKADGTLENIDDIWFGMNPYLQTVDTSVLTGENGTLRMAVVSSLGEPFCYKKDGKIVGYDIDIAARFCAEFGYGLQIIDCESHDIALEGLKNGEYDLFGSCITVTEERKEFVDFSSPNYYGGIVIISKGAQKQSTSEISFFKTVQNSFKKTFIREQRWKMFASGLGVTLLITVFSAVFGTALGFGTFLLYRKQDRIFNTAIDCISRFLQMTPVVVILMIFYYLIFAKAGISGISVSIFAFSLMFACSVTNLFKTAVKAVDIGQTLAVRALGYKDTKGFMRMILPQAIPHFVPGYKGEIVGLIKNTSIVSYVAVQDLTMITDIIRSRTYDAFFPLIFSAVIYFLMALLLTKLIERIEIKTDPCNRKQSRILSGVKTDD